MINLPEWLIPILAALGGGAVTLLIRNAVQHTRNEGSAKAAQAIANEAKAAASDAYRLAALAERDLAQFREKVAGEYATLQLIDRLESRLVAAVDRIGERFDNFIMRSEKQ
jgi:phage I-like protein